MKNNIRISIIIPTFNNQLFLPKCLNSILNQSYKNIEIIVVDDGSTDDTPLMCDYFAKHNKNIHVIHQKNHGVSSARNIGVRKATGQFILFVDSDDVLHKNMINILANSITDDKNLIVCKITRNPAFSVPKKSKVISLNKEKTLQKILFMDEIDNGPCAKLIPSDIAKDTNFNPKITVAEDLDYLYKIMQKISTVNFIKQELYYYRNNPSSAMHKPFSKKRLSGVYVTKKILDSARRSNNTKLFKAAKFRHIMESFYILLSIPMAEKKYNNTFQSVIKEMKKITLTDIFNNKISVKHRVLLLLLKLNPDLTIKLIVFLNSLKDGSIQNPPSVNLRYYGARNLGDDLFIKIFLDRYVNNFLLGHREYAMFSKKYNVQKRDSWITTIGTRTYQILFKKPVIPYGLSKGDVLVYTGGSLFIEDKHKERWFEEKKFYENLFTPYFIIGANIGPFHSKNFIKNLKSIFNGAQDVCLRDRASYDMVKTIPQTRISSDIVFSMKSTNVITQDNTCIISVIDISKKYNAKIANNYKKTILSIIQHILDNGTHKIILMSFCKKEGDEKACKQIFRSLDARAKKRVSIYKYRGNIDHALQKFSSSDLIVGTRFHANILGLIFGKKILPIAYSDKTINILKDINFAGKIIDVRNIDPLNIDNIEFRNIPKVNIERLRKLSEKQFQKLDKILKKR